MQVNSSQFKAPGRLCINRLRQNTRTRRAAALMIRPKNNFPKYDCLALSFFLYSAFSTLLIFHSTIIFRAFALSIANRA